MPRGSTKKSKKPFLPVDVESSALGTAVKLELIELRETEIWDQGWSNLEVWLCCGESKGSGY